jgi:hypothetical protein
LTNGEPGLALETFTECNFEKVFSGSAVQRDLLKQTRIEM